MIKHFLMYCGIRLHVCSLPPLFVSQLFLPLRSILCEAYVPKVISKNSRVYFRKPTDVSSATGKERARDTFPWKEGVMGTANCTHFPSKASVFIKLSAC
jgi:hypothetical protein